MADYFTLTFSFGVMVDGEPVKAESSVTIHQPLDDRSLRTAMSHAAHEGFGRLWEQLKPKPEEAKDGD